MPSSSTRPPNLLVIMPDQLRATALGMYGNPQTRHPHLEALAASGAMFRYAFTPYPVCVPARVAFWTGRWPHLTGSRTNTIYLQPGETHLLQPLYERGYATALIGKNHCFTESDVERYFDVSYPVGHGGPADDGGDPEVAAARQWVRRLERDGPGLVRRAGAGEGAAYAAGRTHRLPFQLIANAKLKMIRTHDWKYVHQAGGPSASSELALSAAKGQAWHELYDLRNDPHELTNLVDSPEYQDRVHDFQHRLLDWAITTEDTLPLPDPSVQAANRAV